MTHLQNIEQLFQTIYSPLDKATILRLNEQYSDGGLNNVVVGLQKECFGALLMDDTNEIVYRLFCVNGETGLQGDIVELTISNPNRNYLVFYSSQFLEHKYSGLDTIITFNTFQTQTRTFLEQLNYLTVSSTEFKNYAPDSLILAKDVKGILNVPLIHKKEFYKGFFGNKNISKIEQGEDYIYIMLNSRNNLMKIGKSNKPFYREKTLQGQEPEIMLITYWKAPSTIERQLHKEFSHKRQRGEWFNLSFKDLQKIKEIMTNYE